MQIGEWVRAARARAELTQAQLGERLHVTKANVSGWENNRHEPSYSQMLLIEEVTGHPMPHRSWPLPLVDRDRWARLQPEARGYVQRAMNEAITECERAAASAAIEGNRKAA